MRQQALGRLLVLGEIPDGPEIWKERRKAALRTDREAVSPALLRDLWRIALGYCPGAGRIHDQCALAGNQPLVVIGVVPSRYIRWQERDQLLVVFESLTHRVGLDRKVTFGVD